MGRVLLVKSYFMSKGTSSNSCQIKVLEYKYNNFFSVQYKYRTEQSESTDKNFWNFKNSNLRAQDTLIAHFAASVASGRREGAPMQVMR